MTGKFAAAALLALVPVVASAHFGIITPSASTVPDQKQATIKLDIAFAHPMEQSGMTMAKPEAFVAVDAEGKKTDLLATLKPAKYLGKDAWTASYKFAKPGVMQFAFTPKAYWEPAEDKFIIHYTKVIVPAFGEEEGWDAPAGLPTEIIPLTRPFANYAGNVFRGQVMSGGKPVPNAEVEVEFLNKGSKRQAPNDYYVTQVVKADSQGIFVYAAPWAGWWGFAALTDAPYKLKFKGQEKDVELGAVLWTEFK